MLSVWFLFFRICRAPKVQEGLHILRNLQHKSLYLIQQLTTTHTVRQCTCIQDADSDLSIKGAVLFQKTFFFKYQKITRRDSKRKLQDMVKG